MKKFLSIVAAAVISLAAFAASDITVNTAPSASLNGSSVRLTIVGFDIDRTAKLNVEVRSADGTIIDKRTVALSAAQVKTWVNSVDPDAWIKSAALLEVGLTEAQ